MSNNSLVYNQDEVESTERQLSRSATLKPVDLEVVDTASFELHQKHLKELEAYLALVENPNDVDEFTAPIVLAKISYGFRKSGEYMAVAKYNFRRARAQRKRAEAIAALDDFIGFISQRKAEGKELKPTDGTREHYIALNPKVIEAVDKEAFFEAMMEQLDTIKQEFFMAISTVKAQVYGRRDSSMLSGASVAVNERE